MFQRIQGLNVAELVIEDDFNSIDKGNIAELHVGLELIMNNSCYEKTQLYYWQREAKKQSSRSRLCHSKTR